MLKRKKEDEFIFVRYIDDSELSISITLSKGDVLNTVIAKLSYNPPKKIGEMFMHRYDQYFISFTAFEKFLTSGSKTHSRRTSESST